MFAGIYYGSKYGGSTTSILMKCSGEAASVVTCLDGYPMAARSGRSGPDGSGGWPLLCRDSRGSGVNAVCAAFNGWPWPWAAGILCDCLGRTDFAMKLTGTSMLKSALMAVGGVLLENGWYDFLSGINRFAFGG